MMIDYYSYILCQDGGSLNNTFSFIVLFESPRIFLILIKKETIQHPSPNNSRDNRNEVCLKRQKISTKNIIIPKNFGSLFNFKVFYSLTQIDLLYNLSNCMKY